MNRNQGETIESLRCDVAALGMELRDAGAMEDSLLASLCPLMDEVEAYKDEVRLLLGICAEHGISIPADAHCVEISPLLPDGLPGKGPCTKSM